ncbi:unnamed protein product, partial [Brenthis ino]
MWMFCTVSHFRGLGFKPRVGLRIVIGVFVEKFNGWGSWKLSHRHVMPLYRILYLIFRVDCESERNTEINISLAMASLSEIDHHKRSRGLEESRGMAQYLKGSRWLTQYLEGSRKISRDRAVSRGAAQPRGGAQEDGVSQGVAQGLGGRAGT